jgi:Ca2+-binding RTX toxin-like protein
VAGQARPGAGDDTIRGLGGNDALYGLDGNDVLDGGSGSDRLFGGNGDDSYVVDSTRDLVDETGGSGADTIRASVSVNLGDTTRVRGSIENVVLTGTSALSAQGNAAANVLTGNAAGNTLAGMAGADTLLGGGGTDTASYAASNAGVDVSLALGRGRGGHAEGDSLGSIENLVGSNYNDILEGDGGANQLSGGSGVDTLSYANAASGVEVNLAVTSTQQTGGAGADRVSGFENLTGSAFADRLAGTSGNNLLAGGAGNDRLDGGRGNDVLIGGPGEDVLVGGSGGDTFVFATAAGGLDTVADFATRSDRLQISAAGFGGGLEAGDRVTLVAASQLGLAAGPAGEGYFVYDNSGADAGTLYWDATGGSSADAVAFARLQPGATVAASDFWVV